MGKRIAAVRPSAPHAARRLERCADLGVSTLAAVTRRLSARERGRAPLLELVLRAVTGVRVVLGQEPLRHLAIDLEALGLPVGGVRPADVGALVPVDPEPPERVHHAVEGLLGDPRRVRVLDPQNEHPSVVAREHPREQARPNVAAVERPRGRRREPGPDARAHEAASTGLASVPTPSTSTSTTSPAASGPTPSGVPVRSTSPGNSVMNDVMYSISVATP